MRAVATPIALVGVVAFSTSALAFLVAPPAAPAWRSLGGSTPTRNAGPAVDAEAHPSPSSGRWCTCGVALMAALAASGRIRGLHTRARGSVAVRVGKAANLITERLEQAFKMSADIQKSMTEVEGRNALILQKLNAAKGKVQALEAERDQLKGQLLGLVEQVDTALMGPLKTSTAMATQLSALKEKAAGSGAPASAKVKSLEAERDALKDELEALVGQIDDALLGPLKQSTAMAEQLTAMKEAVGVSTGAKVAAPAAVRAAGSYPPPKAKRGAKKGKTFFPLPYPDFSIGQCYSY